MRIKGIPLKVHPSWFAVLLLFTWTSQEQVMKVSAGQLSVGTSWLIGLITALLLFLSVLLHELGHSLVALREGVKVKSITLFFLGGVAQIEKECRNPMGSLRVAMAGPLVSILIAIVLLKSVSLFSESNILLSNLFSQLGSLNLVLALFNLLPGLPLDGGVILKSMVWKFTGSQKKGIEVATDSGRFLSLLAIGLGFFIALRGGGLGGFWLIVLGWFGFAASRSQKQILSLQIALTKLNVNKVSSKRFRVLEGDQSLKKLSMLRLSSKDESPYSEWILICRSGRWVGYLTDRILNDVPVQYWDRKCLFDYSKPLEELPSISQKDPLWKAIKTLEVSEEGRLLVFNDAGLPSGTLDRVDIGKSLLKFLGVEIPHSFLKAARATNVYPLGLSLPEIVDSMLSNGLVNKNE